MSALSDRYVRGVLVIDDEEIMIKLIAAQLLIMEVTPFVARNLKAAESILKANAEAIDAVLIDTGRLRQDVRELLTCLRAIKPDLPYCLLDSYAAEVTMLPDNCICTLRNPCRLTELQDCLSELRGEALLENSPQKTLRAPKHPTGNPSTLP